MLSNNGGGLTFATETLKLSDVATAPAPCVSISSPDTSRKRSFSVPTDPANYPSISSASTSRRRSFLDSTDVASFIGSPTSRGGSFSVSTGPAPCISMSSPNTSHRESYYDSSHAQIYSRQYSRREEHTKSRHPSTQHSTRSRKISRTHGDRDHSIREESRTSRRHQRRAALSSRRPRSSPELRTSSHRATKSRSRSRSHASRHNRGHNHRPRFDGENARPIREEVRAVSSDYSSVQDLEHTRRTSYTRHTRSPNRHSSRHTYHQSLSPTFPIEIKNVLPPRAPKQKNAHSQTMPSPSPQTRTVAVSSTSPIPARTERAKTPRHVRTVTHASIQTTPTTMKPSLQSTRGFELEEQIPDSPPPSSPVLPPSPPPPPPASPPPEKETKQQHIESPPQRQPKQHHRTTRLTPQPHALDRQISPEHSRHRHRHDTSEYQPGGTRARARTQTARESSPRERPSSETKAQSFYHIHQHHFSEDYPADRAAHDISTTTNTTAATTVSPKTRNRGTTQEVATLATTVSPKTRNRGTTQEVATLTDQLSHRALPAQSEASSLTMSTALSEISKHPSQQVALRPPTHDRHDRARVQQARERRQHRRKMRHKMRKHKAYQPLSHRRDMWLWKNCSTSTPPNVGPGKYGPKVIWNSKLAPPPPPKPRSTRRLPPPKHDKHFSPPPSPVLRQQQHLRVLEDGKAAVSSRAARSVAPVMDRLDVKDTSGVKNVDDTPGVDQCLSTTGLIEGSLRKSRHHRTVIRSKPDLTPRVKNVDDIASADQRLSSSGLLERYASPRSYRQLSASKLRRSASKLDRSKTDVAARVSTRRQLADREDPRKGTRTPQKKLWHHHYHHLPKGGRLDSSALMAASIREAEEAAARAAEALARTHHSMRLGVGDDDTDASSFRTASTRRSRSFR